MFISMTDIWNLSILGNFLLSNIYKILNRFFLLLTRMHACHLLKFLVYIYIYRGMTMGEFETWSSGLGLYPNPIPFI